MRSLSWWIWHVAITAVIGLMAFSSLRLWLTLRMLRSEIALARHLLVTWAQTWGQPESVVRAALARAVQASSASQPGRNAIKGLILVVAAGWALVTGTAHAQTPVPNPSPPSTRICWTHDGVDITSWQLQLDATPPTTVTATVTGAERCTPFPAVTPGAHTIKVAACRAIPNFPDLCGWSDPLAVVSVVVSSPTGLRVAPPGGSD